jgi:membrane protein HdeD
MADGNNVLLGILAIILGILVIAFPLFSVFTASVLAGFAIIFLGIWLLTQSFGTWGTSKAASIAFLILGIIAIVGGIGLFGSILAFSFLASFWLYFAGFFLIISGIMSFFVKEETVGKGSGALGVILGILYIILAPILANPYYLALFIGFWLIIEGITLFFVNPSNIIKTEKSEV